jgi:uncharacterized membrane protein HdeD (DUF308 family)
MTEPVRAAGEVHSLGATLHRLHDKWGSIVAFGILLIVLGLAAAAFAIAATKTTVVVNGVVFLIAGIAEIGVGMQSQAWARFFFWVIGGLLYLIAGLICVFNPDLASVILTLMLGAGLVAAGIVRIILGFQLPADHPRAMVLLAGAVTVLLGLIIIGHWPKDSVEVLGTLLGVDLLFHGAGWVSFGLGLRARR